MASYAEVKAGFFLSSGLVAVLALAGLGGLPCSAWREAPPVRPNEDRSALPLDADAGAAAEQAILAIRRDPSDARAHHALHAAYERLRRVADLPGVYARLRAFCPRDPYLALEHGRALFRAGRLDEAIALLDVVRGVPTAGREATRLAGLARVEAGRHAEAAILLSELEELDPETARYLGIALVFSGAPERAVPLLESVVAASPGPEAWFFLALAYRDAGRLDPAETLLLALAGDPKGPAAARAELARLYLGEPGSALRQPGDALHYAESAFRDGWPCYDVLARAYLETGDREMAALTARAGLDDPHVHGAEKARCRELSRVLGEE